MEAQQIYHDTCTYCVNNENPNRLSDKINCKLKDSGECNYWNKNKFESIREDEIKLVDDEIDRRERNRRTNNATWNLTVFVLFSFWGLILLITIITAVLSYKLRFANPTLTETQLCIEFTNRYPGLVAAIIGIVLLSIIIRIRDIFK